MRSARRLGLSSDWRSTKLVPILTLRAWAGEDVGGWAGHFVDLGHRVDRAQDATAAAEGMIGSA
jgi:hypothetical protein